MTAGLTDRPISPARVTKIGSDTPHAEGYLPVSAEGRVSIMNTVEGTKGDKAAADGGGVSPDAQTPRKGMNRRVFIGRSAGVALAVGGIGSFVAACGGGGGSGGSSGGGGVVNVLGWQSYLEPEVKKLFEEENPGITLNTLPAASDQEMFTKMKAGGSAQVDVVFCNSGWAPTYYENEITEPMDIGEFKGTKTLYPVFYQDASLPYVIKPETEMLVYPNMWSPLSMTWNTLVYQAPEPYSWSSLWDPKIPEDHVMMFGGNEDFLAYAGLEQGVPREKIYAMEGATLEKAANRLIELKPFQINPNSPSLFVNTLASQKAWIGPPSGLGVGLQISEQVGKEGAGKSVVPKEGTLGWIDGPQMVKGAKNVENAKKFINFWGSNEKFLTWLWESYKYNQCSKAATERTLAKGGKEKEFAESIGVNKPQLATQIVQQRPADNTQAWAEAWDEVQAS
ncbi:MAG: extracellular solute-binding protein [Actinobacteria bacterium]|nr:extracellular solute-binding protein [Actinomycetota bacterium]